MDHEGQLRNLRDFLLVYNRMTEICFQRCTSNFNYRNLTMDEERCVDNCAGKLIRTNHRLMGTYVQLMPAMVQKRMQEMEIKAAEVAKAEAAASALENPSTASTDASPSTLGIPDVSFPMPESPQISTVINNSSNINTSVTNGPAFGETQSFSDVHTVTNKAQTFRSESLDGLVTQVNSSVHETPSAGRDGQSPQTPS